MKKQNQPKKKEKGRSHTPRPPPSTPKAPKAVVIQVQQKKKPEEKRLSREVVKKMAEDEEVESAVWLTKMMQSIVDPFTTQPVRTNCADRAGAALCPIPIKCMASASTGLAAGYVMTIYFVPLGNEYVNSVTPALTQYSRAAYAFVNSPGDLLQGGNPVLIPWVASPAEIIKGVPQDGVTNTTKLPPTIPMVCTAYGARITLNAPTANMTYGMRFVAPSMAQGQGDGSRLNPFNASAASAYAREDPVMGRTNRVGTPGNPLFGYGEGMSFGEFVQGSNSRSAEVFASQYSAYYGQTTSTSAGNDPRDYLPTPIDGAFTYSNAPSLKQVNTTGVDPAYSTWNMPDFENYMSINNACKCEIFATGTGTLSISVNITAHYQVIGTSAQTQQWGVAEADYPFPSKHFGRYGLTSFGVGQTPREASQRCGANVRAQLHDIPHIARMLKDSAVGQNMSNGPDARAAVQTVADDVSCGVLCQGANMARSAVESVARTLSDAATNPDNIARSARLMSTLMQMHQTVRQPEALARSLEWNRGRHGM